jgi:hypothetical protein
MAAPATVAGVLTATRSDELIADTRKTPASFNETSPSDPILKR